MLRSSTKYDVFFVYFSQFIAILILLCPNTFPQANVVDRILTELPPMTLYLDQQSRVVYSVGYAAGEGGRLYWTIDEPIITSTNFYTVAPAYQCPPNNTSCGSPPLEVNFDISRYCDGETHRLSAQALTAGFSTVQRANGLSSFTCTGGGSSLPLPSQLPVVVVPGIMGSVIKGPYQGDTVQYWTNFNLTGTTVRNLTLDSTSSYYRTGLYASDVLRSVSIFNIPVYEPLLTNLSGMGFNRPYSVSRHFEQNLGCDYSLKNPDLTLVPNLFVFPYDWRQDNNLTATKLKDYVRCVQQLYPPGTKVNVIAHSMGGLVVRRYIVQAQQNSEPHRLGKVITIASPFLGSAQATYQLYTGGNLERSSIALSPSSIQFLAPHFPSIHQLLPSRKYHQFRNGIIYERGDVDGNGISNEHYGFDRIVQPTNADFPATSPGTVGASFHDFVGQDDWRADQSGIKYFHVIGQQAELLTTDALYVSWSTLCKRTGNRLTGCFKNRRYMPVKGLGDGTVSTLSTAFGWNNDPVFPTSDLAPPGIRIFVRNSLNANTDNQADHTKMTQDVKVRDLIAYILNVGQQPILHGELFELFRPNSLAQNARMTPLSNDPSHYLTIAGQTQIAVSDQAGNTAAIENGFLRNDIPGLNSYEMVASDSVMLTFATGTAYTAEFQAGTTPMEIELVTGTGNQTPTSAVRYKDLDLPVNTHMRLTISQTGIAELRIDADNNGTYETLITPTVNLSGGAATDTEPPTVNINPVAGQGNTATVNITADDFQSGVNKIWYSTDGVSFDQFTAPFNITLTSTPITIEAFADDNAANRSGLVSRAVSLTSSVIPIADCISSGPDGYRAWFGFQNQTNSAVSVPVGLDNTFFPPPGNLGQITNFQTGSISRAFSVRMQRKSISWRLRGTDGLLRIATASKANTPLCQ
jgi:pimeloyl-ACP methyl ester carboxylesterase